MPSMKIICSVIQIFSHLSMSIGYLRKNGKREEEDGNRLFFKMRHLTKRNLFGRMRIVIIQLGHPW